MSAETNWSDGQIATAVLAVFAGAANLALAVFVIAACWQWHAVPLGAPDMPWSSTLVAVLAVRALRYRYRPEGQRPDPAQEELAQALGVATVWLIVLAIAWAVAP